MKTSEINKTGWLWQLARSFELSAESAKYDEVAKTYRSVAKQLQSRIRMIEESNQEYCDLANMAIHILRGFVDEGLLVHFALTATQVILWVPSTLSDELLRKLATIKSKKVTEDTIILVTISFWIEQSVGIPSPIFYPIADLRYQDDHGQDDDNGVSEFDSYKTSFD